MADNPANVGRDQAGRFRKGSTGNPAGKRPGTRHRATLAVEALLEGQAAKLTRKAIALALEGDTMALRLCLDRIAPPRRGQRIPIDLGPLEGADGLAGAATAVLSAMAAGACSAEEAQSMIAVIEAAGAAYERRDLEARIVALEAGTDGGLT